MFSNDDIRGVLKSWGNINFPELPERRAYIGLVKPYPMSRLTGFFQLHHRTMGIATILMAVKKN
jgi:hypothetical protein